MNWTALLWKEFLRIIEEKIYQELVGAIDVVRAFDLFDSKHLQKYWVKKDFEKDFVKIMITQKNFQMKKWKEI